jgi:hypothetical protein
MLEMSNIYERYHEVLLRLFPTDLPQAMMIRLGIGKLALEAMGLRLFQKVVGSSPIRPPQLTQ